MQNYDYSSEVRVEENIYKVIATTRAINKKSTKVEIEDSKIVEQSDVKLNLDIMESTDVSQNEVDVSELLDRGELNIFENSETFDVKQSSDPSLEFIRKKGSYEVDFEQLVVPGEFRQTLLAVAHDKPTSGHFGVQKKKERLLQNC